MAVDHKFAEAFAVCVASTRVCDRRADVVRDHSGAGNRCGRHHAVGRGHGRRAALLQRRQGDSELIEFIFSMCNCEVLCRWHLPL